MPGKEKNKKNFLSGFFKDSINYKIGIPLFILGVLLLASPFISDAYANYQQSRLLEQYRESLDSTPQLSFELTEGAPTGFENVILKIPRLDLEVAVIDPPKTSNEFESLLRQGPVFYRSSAKPGAAGFTTIGAHRVDHGNYFHDLDFMEKGDKIKLNTPSYNFTYTVKDNIIININNEEEKHMFDDPTDEHIILLISCEPKHTRQLTSLRIVVIGELEEVISS